MVDIIQIGVIIACFVIAIIIAFLLTLIFPKKSYLPNTLKGQENFYKVLILLVLISLLDFYFVSMVPVVSRLENLLIEFLIMTVFLILSIITIFLCNEIRNLVLNLEISFINRNLNVLKYTMSLILIQATLVSFFYFFGLVTLTLGIDKLPGTVFIFDIKQSEVANLSLITDSLPLLSVLILSGIKCAFLLLHHGSIILVFITLLVIFDEWSGRTRETSINYFRIFALGFVIQGIGQFIQAFGIVFTSYFLAPELDIPWFFALPIVLGSLIVLIGVILYYFSFMMAALSLIGNISHMLIPPAILALYKITVIIFPIIYSLLYGLLLVLNLFWFFGLGGTEIQNQVNTIESLTHLVDIPAMILLPVSCGLFFLVAYYQTHEKKKGAQISDYLMWAFLSLFFIFGVGNNTMSTVSWFGMLHGPITLLGSIVFLYGLSRVADHASRYRQVIKYIREKPNDFLFLTKLGEAERKIQLWEKVESLVKEDIIKPLVPIKAPIDETKTVAEIKSYMDEIYHQYKKLQRPTSTG